MRGDHTWCLSRRIILGLFDFTNTEKRLCAIDGQQQSVAKNREEKSEESD